MPTELNQSRKWLLLTTALSLAGLLIYFNVAKNRVSALRPSLALSTPPEGKNTNYVFEQLPTGKGILFSETYIRRSRGNISSGDLWLQRSGAQKRFVASAVTRAGFSPDGQKLAYMTADHELHIETIDGKPLAHLQRIHDHNWSSDSATIILSAMVSIDYPELQQTVVYDLDSGTMNPLSSGK